MKSHPTKKSKHLKEIREIENFISGADKNHINNKDLPWNAPGVRTDVKKMFMLRLPESTFLMLQFLQQKTNKSMQKICLDILMPAINKEISHIVGTKD